MPNWCHNKLVVEGDPEAVSRWVERGASIESPGEDQPFYLEAFYPTPVDAESQATYTSSWHTVHWGTKWDVSFSKPLVGSKSEVGFFLEERMALYRFDTAWAPPLAWLEHVCREWRELSFSLQYGEPGMDFGGKVLFAKGELKEFCEGDALGFLQEGDMWF